VAYRLLNARGTRITWTLLPDNQGGLRFEREIAPSGAQSNRHYLSTGGSTFAVLVTNGAPPTLQATDTQPLLPDSVAAVRLCRPERRVGGCWESDMVAASQLLGQSITGGRKFPLYTLRKKFTP